MRFLRRITPSGKRLMLLLGVLIVLVGFLLLPAITSWPALAHTTHAQQAEAKQNLNPAPSGPCVASTATRAIVNVYGYAEYADPGTTLTNILNAWPEVGAVVVNLSAGPGTSYSPYFGAFISAVESAGICTIGYVDTAHGANSEAMVKTEIGEWMSLYGIDGIWLDDFDTNSMLTNCYSSTTTTEPCTKYYNDLYTYTRTTESLDMVIGNPGSFPDKTYMSDVDMMIVTEGAQSYFTSVTPPSWFITQPPSSMGVVVYGVSDDPAMIAGDMKRAAKQHEGWIEETDFASSNLDHASSALAALPHFWFLMLSLLASQEFTIATST